MLKQDCEERVYEMKNLETISNSNHCEQITKSKEFQKFYQFLDCCQHEVERIKST